jgi:ABC-type proline/glycine betaine transport system substrate-binding protein
MLASSLATGTAAVAISLHAQAESERKLCGVVSVQDEAWSRTTPTTATGQRVAEAMRKLRRDLGCPAE